MRRAPLLVVPALVALVVSIAASAPAAPAQPVATASTVVSRIAAPGSAEQVSFSVVAPPSADQSLPGYLYPEGEGSILRIGSASQRAAAQPGISSGASAAVGALAVSIFGGEITADAIDARAGSAAGSVSASGNVSASTITGLSVLGQLITPTPNLVVQLGDWGTLEVLGSNVQTTQKAPRSASASITALRVKLSAAHGGLTAGSVVEVGSASTTASVAPDVKPPTSTTPATTTPGTTGSAPDKPSADAPKEPGGAPIVGAPPELVRPAPAVTAQLSSGGYVFPVYGPASYGDTFGAYRGDVAGNWHHGEDIFAPLGTPLLAVADGTVFSVGWNDVGGWRLWLRDRQGNEFYYAHLSAYSPLAVNGRQVRAGDVLGFMGNTGDARASAVHLHFEIHPVGLLSRGYDGAVAPYPYLNAWRRAQDASFAAGRIYLPADGPGSGTQGVAPPAGAVLLEADDISRTSGLVPGSLESSLAGRAPTSPTGGQDR